MWGTVTHLAAGSWLSCSSIVTRCLLLTSQRGFASRFQQDEAAIYDRQMKRHKRRSGKEHLNRMLKKNSHTAENVDSADYSEHMVDDFRAQVDEMMWNAATNTRPRTAKEFRMHKRAWDMWLRYQERQHTAMQQDASAWSPPRSKPRMHSAKKKSTHHQQTHTRANTGTTNNNSTNKARHTRKKQQQQQQDEEEYVRTFHAYWQHFGGTGAWDGNYEGWYDPDSNGGTWSFRFSSSHSGTYGGYGNSTHGGGGGGSSSSYTSSYGTARLPAVHLAALGLQSDTQLTTASLKTAFKQAAVRWHPDRHHSGCPTQRAAAEEKFKAAQHAYDVLKQYVN